MALRRSHQKSRHGCLECKRRRVKCDETRPVCGNCFRRQTECEYDSTGPLRWMTDEPSRSPRPPSDRQPQPQHQHQQQPPPPPPPPDLSLLGRYGHAYNNPNDPVPPPLNLCDLELMMQWCNTTYAIFTRNSETDPIWRSHVPEEALSHPFLMHGILAMSALHIASTRKPPADGATGQDGRDYLRVAVAHQNQALALFREQLSNINATNGKAMFTFASLTVLYAFGFPHPGEPENQTNNTAVDDLVQVFALVRGMQQVLNQTMGAVFDDPKWEPLRLLDEYGPSLSESARTAIDRLYKANDNCARMDPILHDSSMYEETIENLADLMAATEAGLGFSLACRWVIRLQPSYVDRVREHRPLALVILAHFCVVLDQVKGVWFGQEWAMRVVRSVWYLLPDQWRSLVEECVKEIFGEVSDKLG